MGWMAVIAIVPLVQSLPVSIDLTRDRIVRGTKGAKPGRGRRRLPSGGRAFPDLRASSLGCPAIFGAAEPTRAYSRPDTRGTDDGNSAPPRRETPHGPSPP